MPHACENPFEAALHHVRAGSGDKRPGYPFATHLRRRDNLNQFCVLALERPKIPRQVALAVPVESQTDDLIALQEGIG